MVGQIKNSTDDILKYLSFSPENMIFRAIWYFVQFVSFKDTLHTMSKALFAGKNKNRCHQFVVSWICPESDEG